MAFGIFTIRPKSPEEIHKHIRLYRPHESITTKSGDNIVDFGIVSRAQQLGRRRLARFVLDKNVKGDSGSWMRDGIGEVVQLGVWSETGIAGVTTPGNMLFASNPFPRYVEVPSFADFTDEKEFSIHAVAKAAFEAVNGLPDARETDAYQQAVEMRQQMIERFRTKPDWLIEQ